MRYSALRHELIKIRGMVLLACVVVLVGAARAEDVEKRKAFAQKLTKDIARAGLQKIYVPDFTDSAGKQVVLGRYFAATFSALLNDNTTGFGVISRVDVHRYLSQSGRSDHDLSTPDVLGKLASDFGSDGIPWGSVSLHQDAVAIDLVMRDALGKEVFQSKYEEKLNPTLRDDSEAGQSGADFYFVGLDGVTLPKCLYCPIPDYPVGQGHRSLEGDVVLSVW